MGRLDGKVAVITGGASGIGRATVLRFIDEGASVVAADMNEANGAELLADVKEAGSGDRIEFVRTDVTDEADVEQMIATAVDRFGQLDVVFNNAGVGGAFGAITEIELEDWRYTFDVLVAGVFLGTKHAARQMIGQGWGGAIVNTASIAGLSGGAGPMAYSAAKASVINLTKSTASELARHRIRVNAICPGPIMTPLLHRGQPDKITEHMQGSLPWPDIGEPDDIAGAALFLASADAGFVTGESIVVDGGMTALGPAITSAVIPAKSTAVGVNRGTTGLDSVVRRRV